MAVIFPEDPCPIVIVDVDYRQSEAVAAAIVANTWDTPNTIETCRTRIADVKPYQPGAFFERELPCILQLLALIKSEFRVVVIDGYVELDEHGRPGLGAHLHTYLQKNVVVVGVAKTAFHGSTFAVPVLRGTSDKPLYVTARGIDKEHAAALVRRMHGTYRLPTLIKEVDTLARR